jgi:membrane-associated phospholipid phosphatase
LSNRLRWVALAAVAAAFATLALLVSTGSLHGADTFAVRHLMPFSSDHHGGTNELERLLAYRGTHFHLGGVLRLPASPLLSTLLLLIGAALLWRRAGRHGALLWIGVFVAANIIEVACKATITRPDLYTISHGVREPVGLQSSFPSGHALRATLLVFLFASIWRPLRPVLLAWLAVVVVSLELDGVHTPTDILGGLLLAAACGLALDLLDRPRFLGRAPAELEPRARRSRPRAEPSATSVPYVLDGGGERG